jgi:diacylglycerol kinase family enzyme
MNRVWKLAGMLRSFRSGTHGAWKEVRTAKNVAFEIETRRPMPVNADGEIVTSTPARFMVHPKAITVLAPPIEPATQARPASRKPTRKAKAAA